MGYGMMSGYGSHISGFYGLYCLILFILACFVFSLIFWGTYNRVVKNNKSNKKKK